MIYVIKALYKDFDGRIVNTELRGYATSKRRAIITVADLKRAYPKHGFTYTELKPL